MRELSLNVMDVVQNSVTAKSSLIKIIVSENEDEDTLTIAIEDNGCGMTKEQVMAVEDPFYTTRTTRKVGLGVPFFKMAAEMTGGSFHIDSKVSVGTKLKAIFNSSHIDMVPLGDMSATVLPLVTGNTDIDFIYKRERIRKGKMKEFTLDTKEIKAIIGEDVPLDLPEIVVWLGEFLKENTNEIENF